MNYNSVCAGYFFGGRNGDGLYIDVGTTEYVDRCDGFDFLKTISQKQVDLHDVYFNLKL